MLLAKDLLIGDLSHDRDTYGHTPPRAYGLTSLSEKTQKSNHLQMLEQRQHLLLNYLRPWVLVRLGIEPEPPA